MSTYPNNIITKPLTKGVYIRFNTHIDFSDILEVTKQKLFNILFQIDGINTIESHKYLIIGCEITGTSNKDILFKLNTILLEVELVLDRFKESSA